MAECCGLTSPARRSRLLCAGGRRRWRRERRSVRRRPRRFVPARSHHDSPLPRLLVRRIDVVERFDVLVVGAGPAGSTAAYRLAKAGASVLLADKARFPRDKPCGGGLTGRALRLLPVPVDPVVEDAADRFELGLGYHSRFERSSKEPIVLLT